MFRGGFEGIVAFLQQFGNGPEITQMGADCGCCSGEWCRVQNCWKLCRGNRSCAESLEFVQSAKGVVKWSGWQVVKKSMVLGNLQS